MKAIIKSSVLILAAFFIFCISISSAYGDGTFIPAPNRVDMVHDASRNILYITSGAEVLRYKLDTKQFLTPFQLGGDLKGIDLSPDGNMLAVADYSDTGFFLVNLTTPETRKVSFPAESDEGGTFSVAFDTDGNILLSTSYNGSGWVPLRKYNPGTGQTTEFLRFIGQDTMLNSSADGQIIGFAESNGSSGSWGRYRANDGNIVERTGYTDGTSWYNFEIGTNRNGTQFAIPTYGGTFIYNSDFSKIATIGEYAGPQPVGVVYDPSKDIVYFAWAETQEVRAYETTNFTQVKTYDFEYTFQHTGNHAYQQGRLKISRNSTLLFATVEGGIRYVNTAKDATPSYKLTVSMLGAGAGSVTSSPTGIYCLSVCTQDYTSGKQVTLSATPHRGSVFSGWSGEGCTGKEKCTVSMNAAKTVTATFVKGETTGRSNFIPSPDRVDMVHDPIRNILYITSGENVIRYDLITEQFLTPFLLGGNLKGIDLSPDSNTLAVADQSIIGIHLINLQTGSIRKVLFPPSFSEKGTYSVAYGNDGNILVTTSFNGSGWVPLRKYNPKTDQTKTLLTSIGQDSMLNSSADGQIIGFAESNGSSGNWGRYRMTDGNIVERTGYTNGTSWFNYEIGTNRKGTQFAIPTYGGAYIYNSDFVKIATIGQYAGPQPIGVVYDPFEDIVYFAWAGTHEVRSFETTNFTQVKAYDFEYTFQNTGNYAYQQGRLKISRDGILLFATVDGGIRYIETYPKGDVNGSGTVGLADVILALQAVSHIRTSQRTYRQADVDGDHKIGMAEAIYDLQVVSRLRNNNYPILNSIGDKTGNEGVNLTFTISATDKDNDSLTFSATPLPAGASFNAETKTFTWTPTYSQSGTYQVTFTVVDNYGGQASETISILINDIPVFVAADYYPLNVGDWRDYYLNTSSDTGRIGVTGTKIIGDAVAKIMFYPDGSAEYYTSDGNGIKLYGQYAASDAADVLFISPLLLMPGNVAVGTSNVSSSSWLYNNSGNLYHINITANTNVMALEDIQTENETLHDCIKVAVRYDQYIMERGQSIPGETTYYWLYKDVGVVKEVVGGNTLIIKQSNVNGVIRNY